MEHKVQPFAIKGMQRDLSISKFSPEFAFENMNIRITSRDHETLMAVTNEKGNKEVKIININSPNTFLTIEGVYLGYAALNKNIIIFTTALDDSMSYIYKIYIDTDSILKGELLVEKALGFSINNPIETLAYYELETVQKVYWVDGKNQPRVINFAASKEIKDKWTTESFNFLPSVYNYSGMVDDFKVERVQDLIGGNFPGGSTQYAITFFTKFGQESNIVYTSPLLYNSASDRAASPEESISMAFKLTFPALEIIPSHFTHIRIYSIIRTSLDAVPSVKIATEVEIPEKIFNKITGDVENKIPDLIETNTNGVSVDPSILLYVGGKELIPECISQKDNHLFLGNYTTTNAVVITKELAKEIRGIINPLLQEVLTTNRIITIKDIYNNDRQLFNKAKEVTYLRRGNIYRLGVVLKTAKGESSEPIWLKDYEVTTPIKSIYEENPLNLNYINVNIQVPHIETNSIDLNFLQKLKLLGYTHLQPVIVYPTELDKGVLYQGIVCPTVFNTKDRNDNTIFAQSSWFMRPLGSTPSTTSGSPQTQSISYNPVVEDPYGTPIEGRHYHQIPVANKWGGEIQSITGELDITKNAGVPLSELKPIRFNSTFPSEVTDPNIMYYIDNSIVTFHSPDVDFNSTLLNSEILKGTNFSIVGATFLDTNYYDFDIQVSAPVKGSPVSSVNFQQEIKSKQSYGFLTKGGKNSFPGFPLWKRESPEGERDSFFMVYPWHSDVGIYDEGDGASSILKNKKMSILRHSFSNYYLPTPYKMGCETIRLFNSTETSILRLSPPKNSEIQENIIYAGNVDKLLLATGGDTNTYGSYIVDQGGIGGGITYNLHKLYNSNIKISSPISIKYKSSPHLVCVLDYEADKNGAIGGVIPLPPVKLTDRVSNETINNFEQVYLTKPSGGDMAKLFWNGAPKKAISKGTITIPRPSYLDINAANSSTNILLLVNITRNLNPELIFGGTTEAALRNNTWVNCGPLVDVTKQYSGGGSGQHPTISLKFKEGDTYYQRYDCLKTYPFTLEDINSVTDITSFYCESYINLEGRYDKNIGQKNNLVMSPANFNFINLAYSQKNNFFQYKTLDSSIFSSNIFYNNITWSRPKLNGAYTDNWTSISLASNLDLDSDKGILRSIKKFNNDLFAFQDKGISKLLFNSRVQIPTSEGIPIEITNSGKMDGKVYITTDLGCQNKWSITTTPNGVYFIDNFNHSLYLFNGQNIDPISDRLGFRTFFRNYLNTDKWNSNTWKNFITHYDSINDDVYFTNKDICLNFSESINQFTSFYSYEKVPLMFALDGKFYSLKDNKIWQQEAGDYNSFYGVQKGYYSTVVANQEASLDKIMTNIDLRSDMYKPDGTLISDKTFDYLKIKNEYQELEQNLKILKNKPANLKRKFRVWRIQIDRDQTKVLGRQSDRIRNTWSKITLGSEGKDKNRMIFYDMNLHYYV